MHLKVWRAKCYKIYLKKEKRKRKKTQIMFKYFPVVFLSQQDAVTPHSANDIVCVRS